MTAELDELDLSDGAAELLLNPGFVPPSGSQLEAALLGAVLDGQCVKVTSTRSMPAQVAAALSPGDFFTSSTNDANWWRQQLEACDDELGRAEWALALWSVASGEVISELLSLLKRMLTELHPSRRRTVLRAAEQVSRSGWLKNRPATGNTADLELAALICTRDSSPSETQRVAGTHTEGDRTARQPSLLSVARSRRWIKVDSQPVYR
jgi:hypothetical protein